MKQKVDLSKQQTSTASFLHQMLTVYRHTNKTTKVVLFCRVLQKFLSTYEAQAEGKTMLAFLAQKKSQTNSKDTANSLGSQKPKQIILQCDRRTPEQLVAIFLCRLFPWMLTETTTAGKKWTEKFQPTCGWVQGSKVVSFKGVCGLPTSFVCFWERKRCDNDISVSIQHSFPLRE